MKYIKRISLLIDLVGYITKLVISELLFLSFSYINIIVLCLLEVYGKDE